METQGPQRIHKSNRSVIYLVWHRTGRFCMPLNKGKEHFFMGTIIWIAFSSVSSARSSIGSIHKLYLFHLLCTRLLFSTLRGFHNYYSNAHNNCFKRRVGHQLCSLLPTRGCAPQRGAGASPSLLSTSKNRGCIPLQSRTSSFIEEWTCRVDLNCYFTVSKDTARYWPWHYLW